MSDVSSNKDFQTDWAFSDDFTKHIHISEAISGLNGYYCLGCKKEMQAVKGKIREHYFRHHAKDVDKNHTECVVANRNYRERIAKDILHRLKELKVPAVYKFPAKGEEGYPNELSPSTTIKAFKVKSELSFYEDENCQIQYGQNPTTEERHLLIRPDITFFNTNNEPVLLVEFVVTHKIDNEKRIKLKRLGINTVQIIIPKKPESEIETALKSRSKVKWIYNEIEANTNYIFTSKPSNSGIWEIDDDQRRVFEESYKCRTSQIKYLIRAVKRNLESQSYQRVERNFESEISRVEKATKQARNRSSDMESRFEEEVFREFEEKYQSVGVQEEEFREYVEELERRYLATKKEIRDERDRIIRDTSKEFRSDRSEDEIRIDFKRKERSIRKGIEAIEADIERVERQVLGLSEQLKQSSGIEIGKDEEYRRQLEKEQRQVEFETGKLDEDFDEERRSLEQEERELPNEFRELERKSQREFESARAELTNQAGRLEETVRDEFSRTIETSPRELPEGIKTILEVQRMGHYFEDAKRKEQLYKAARELFNKRAWKAW